MKRTRSTRSRHARPRHHADRRVDARAGPRAVRAPRDGSDRRRGERPRQPAGRRARPGASRVQGGTPRREPLRIHRGEHREGRDAGEPHRPEGEEDHGDERRVDRPGRGSRPALPCVPAERRRRDREGRRRHHRGDQPDHSDSPDADPQRHRRDHGPDRQGLARRQDLPAQGSARRGRRREDRRGPSDLRAYHRRRELQPDRRDGRHRALPAPAAAHRRARPPIRRAGHRDVSSRVRGCDGDLGERSRSLRREQHGPRGIPVPVPAIHPRPATDDVEPAVLGRRRHAARPRTRAPRHGQRAAEQPHGLRRSLGRRGDLEADRRGNGISPARQARRRSTRCDTPIH